MLVRAKLVLAATLVRASRYRRRLSNANFRVRLTSYSCCSSTWTYRDFCLDWLAVKVHYGP